MTDLALIRTATGEVVTRCTEGYGWLDLPGVGQMSPPVLGWEGDGYNLVAITPVAVPAGQQIAGPVTLTYDAASNTAVESATLQPIPVVRPMVPKSLVQSRIIAAGKMDAAYAMLTGNSAFFARWFAPDWPQVYCDDPDAIAFVHALGLDPAVILAVA